MSYYKRIHGIRPIPLLNQYLQPTDPPAGADKKHLSLFARVLERRNAQLKELTDLGLSTLWSYIIDENKPTGKDIQRFLKKLPNKKPIERKQYISAVLYFLINNFHKSIDSTKTQQTRKESLGKVHFLLECFDIAFTDHEEEKAAKEAEKKKKEQELADIERKKQNAKLRALYGSAKESTNRETEGTKEATNPESTTETTQTKETKQEAINNASEMGSAFSKSSAPQGGPGMAADDAIEILDSDDEMEEDVQPAKTAPAAKSTAKPAVSSSPTKPGLSTTSSAAPASDKPKATESQKVTSAAKDTMTAQQREKEYKKSFVSAEKKKETQVIVSSMKPKLWKAVPIHLKSARSQTISMLQDVKPVGVGHGSLTYSSSLEEDRVVRNVSFMQGFHTTEEESSYMDGPALSDIHARYQKWDPFWEVLHDFSLANYSGHQVGYKTSKILNPPKKAHAILSALHMQPNLQSCTNDILGIRPFSKKDGDVRMFLRALPLVVPEKYRKLKSDTHMWPKGTFIQFNGRRMLPIQRKQQSHDATLWKGLCHMLDMSNDAKTAIQNNTPLSNLLVTTKEAEQYNFQLALMKYVTPATLFKRCTGTGPNALTKLSVEEGKALIRQNLESKELVGVDDSDDEDDALDESDIYLTCSLLCPVKMSAMGVPVRGKKCKHIQCFDLDSYIKGNNIVCGGRWKCTICEDFVALQDLMIDGFMAKILEGCRKDVSSSRDKVEIYSNGTWKLLEENRLRYNKKRSSGDGDDVPDSKKMKTDGEPVVMEIIDSDDDD